MRLLLSKSIFRDFVRTSRVVFVMGLVYFLLGCSEHHTDRAEKVVLADDGRALHVIVVGSAASERTCEAAKDLAEYLGRITGGNFDIKEGDGTKGIAVGTYEDFLQLGFEDMFDPRDLTRRDDYLLRTHGNGVYLVGATEFAVQHAVWDFLYRIGHRQFFLTDTWEFVPETPELAVEMDTFEHPDYYCRNGPRYPTYTTDRKLWQRWNDRNRMTSSFSVESGHIYGAIISRNKAVFDQHPEYLALADGVRGGDGVGIASLKFCISNEGLRHLVVKDAEQRIQNNPDVMSISMDPSDGGNWCECEACAEMGSVSDRAVILANEVAVAINKMGYGDKYVGMLAYNLHSPPPTIDVHPKVIVSIATSFIKGGYTFDKLIEGWSNHAEVLGVREYYGTFVWDQGLPRQGNGGSIDYLVETIPYFHENGARFMAASAHEAWIAYGLGYYISARLLWNVNAVDEAEGLIDDFVKKMFENAQGPMRKFYTLMSRDFDTPHGNEDILAHMYGYIQEARALTENPQVLTRLDEMALYTRYAESCFKFKNFKRGDNEREKAAQDVYRHAYRMQSTTMSNAGLLFDYFRQSYVAINVPDEARLTPYPYSIGMTLKNIPPWTSNELFSYDEIEQFIKDGVNTYKKDEMAFQPISFSEDLVPAAKLLGLAKVGTGDMGGNNIFSGSQKMFTWFCPDNKQLTLAVTGGLITKYRDRGNVRFMLFSPKEALVDAVDTDENVPPDGEMYNMVLKSPYDGMHELEWMDGGDRTHVEWPEGHYMTIRASMEDPARLGNNCRLYFYVPKGTESVGGYATDKNIQIFDGDANKLLDMRNTDSGGGYFNIPVQHGQDGTLWQLQCTNLTLRLMTVPPYLARNEKELLLPKEVIEADKSK